MKARLNWGLRGKLAALLLAVSVIPLVLLGYVVDRQLTGQLEAASQGQMVAFREAVRRQFLDQLRSQVELLRELAAPGAPLAELVAPGGEESGAASPVSEEVPRLLQPLVGQAGLIELWLVEGRSGRVLGSAGGAGREPAAWSPRVTRLAAAAIENRRGVVAELGAGEGGGPGGYLLAYALRRGSARPTEALVARIGQEAIDGSVKQPTRPFNSVEAYLVGSDRLYRSRARQDSSAVPMVSVASADVAQAATAGQGTEWTVDGGGQSVLRAFGPLGIDGVASASFDWAVVAEVRRVEALRQVVALRDVLLLTLLLVATAVSLLGLVASARIVRPVQRLAGQLAQVAQGDLAIELAAVKRTDEMGRLLNNFHGLVGALRDQSGELHRGIEVIGSANLEISATATQLATAATETASAVAETTVTIEEVKQTAQLAAEKSQSVSENSRRMVQVSHSGSEAVKRTVERMEGIRSQMEAIAASVVRLNEQSHAIGEIIAAVEDLAEQSNLLAVNAAIEAAKAGEHGRGFAVVAQEVRNLAEQSRQSTGQVRGILNDIQKATTATVMATEQGGKAADGGVVQAREAGEAISQLTQSIKDAAQATAQIAASSQQQFVGVEQVTEAMEGIRQASEQNVQGSHQLTQAAANLNGLAARLKAQVDRYRL